MALSKHESTSQTLPSRLPALKILDICQHESKICSNALCCNKSYNAVSLESSAKGYSCGMNFDVGEEYLDITETDDCAHKSALQNDGGLCVSEYCLSDFKEKICTLKTYSIFCFLAESSFKKE